MGELRSFPSAAGNTRKWADVNVQADGGGCGAGACVCVRVGERKWGRDLNTRGRCTFLFHFFEILSSADNMSALCYNKGCGQRFDPENNPGGE